MNGNLGVEVVYYIGTILGVLFGGAICGLLPYFVGVKRRQRTLAIISFIT